MPHARARTSGFTLLELLVVIAVIAIVAATLYSSYYAAQKNVRVALARNTLNTISMAMEAYKTDFNAYPPDDKPGNGSEALWYYLCRVHKVGDITRDPYLSLSNERLKDSEDGAGKKLVSPLGGDYKYGLLADPDGGRRMYVLVDPGLDRELGGLIDESRGFVKTDARKAKDNLDNSALAANAK